MWVLNTGLQNKTEREPNPQIMIFTKTKELSKCEVDLVKNFLEDLIGKSEDFCRSSAEKKGFTFLDKWDSKMGFVKEDENKYLILSLHFEGMECNFYQVIFKKNGEKWLNSRMINYDIVRRKGVVGN